MSVIFGEKLRSLRKEQNLTQAELGKVMNCSLQCVSKRERDESEPDIETLKKLARLFKISVDELVVFDE